MKALDLTGQRFGRLVATEKAEPVRSGRSWATRWNFLCDCGNQITVRTNSVRMGLTASCGCAARAPDLTGKSFGRLLVIAHTGSRGGCWWCLCRCDCGMEKEVRGASLLKGQTNSCGCLHKKITSERMRRYWEGRSFPLEQRSARKRFTHDRWIAKNADHMRRYYRQYLESHREQSRVNGRAGLARAIERLAPYYVRKSSGLSRGAWPELVDLYRHIMREKRSIRNGTR